MNDFDEELYDGIADRKEDIDEEEEDDSDNPGLEQGFMKGVEEEAKDPNEERRVEEELEL